MAVSELSETARREPLMSELVGEKADRVLHLRIVSGYTQAEVGDKLKVCQQMVCKIESEALSILRKQRDFQIDDTFR